MARVPQGRAGTVGGAEAQKLTKGAWRMNYYFIIIIIILRCIDGFSLTKSVTKGHFGYKVQRGRDSCPPPPARAC